MSAEMTTLPKTEERVILEELAAGRWGEFHCRVCSKVAVLKCTLCPFPEKYYCMRCEKRQHNKRHRMQEGVVFKSRCCDVCLKHKLEFWCKTCKKCMCMTCIARSCNDYKPHILFTMNGARGLAITKMTWSNEIMNEIAQNVRSMIPVKVEKKEKLSTPVSQPPPIQPQPKQEPTSAPKPTLVVAPSSQVISTPTPSPPAQTTAPVPAPTPIVTPAPAPGTVKTEPTSVVAPVIKAEVSAPVAPVVPIDSTPMDFSTSLEVNQLSDPLKVSMLEKYNAANAQVMSLESEIKKLADQVRSEVNKQSMSVALSYNTKRNQMQQALETVMEARDEALARLLAFNIELSQKYNDMHDPTKPGHKPVVNTPILVQRVVPAKHIKCAQIQAKIQALQVRHTAATEQLNQAVENGDIDKMEALGEELGAIEKELVNQDTERCNEFVLLTVFSSRLRQLIAQFREQK
ncbi:hypothetical protein THRCLA_01467 [Thraustotheca clavata]|uniref:B box-type domain-containing protein n=1 Tax=Thraustotheca clavata TaxID=74557 RepID=A0A1W0A874_9STRA|nr:hypothetical protein THRCLA_01467 [Thraustotheca clavata]